MGNKKYFFLAGLPRTGNTLLSSILNQNKDINVSANSFLPDIFAHGESLRTGDLYQNFPDENSLSDYLSSIFDSYYKNWSGKYIIDRSPWGTPQNLHYLKKYLKNDIKIIVTVRDIVQIIASIIKQNPLFLRRNYEYEIENRWRFPGSYKTELEIKCEIITSSYGQLEHSMFSLLNLLQEENKKYLHIIEYDDLINDTENVIDKLYDFLEIENYNHDYENISNFNVNGMIYNDEIHQCGLHDVCSSIRKKNYDIGDILTEDIISKYSGREFWRN